MTASLNAARATGRYERKLANLARAPLLIDEISYLPIERLGANLFFQLISRRYERGPMILTSKSKLAVASTGSLVPFPATSIYDRAALQPPTPM